MRASLCISLIILASLCPLAAPDVDLFTTGAGTWILSLVVCGATCDDAVERTADRNRRTGHLRNPARNCIE